MRTIVAHIYRLVAADLTPGVLQQDASLRTNLTDWLVDTLKYLQSATAGGLLRASNNLLLLPRCCAQDGQGQVLQC